ncbi:MAG TPA: response regulator, partial [Thermoanaerobaculia bacterium]|nr:response regulator [Thermoanaerobaculia bacterium]
MTARDCIVLVDDDRDIVEGLAMILERPGRTVVLCSDVESAQIALERFPVTHVVSDVQFSGSFGFEGLHFLRRIREQQPSCVTVLISGAVTDDLEAEARKHGATAVLSKPFAMAEFEDALGGAAAASAAEF